MALLLRNHWHGQTEIATRWAIKMLISILPSFAKSRLHYFEKLALGLIERMIKERISSSISMTTDVFMKQVRRLTYFQVYNNPDWKFRRTSNLIYELKKDDFKKKKIREEKLFKWANKEMQNPGEKIHEAASIAASMPTTLWFTDEDIKVNRLNYLIACGQFSTCFNLLYYLSEIKESSDSSYRSSFLDGGDMDNLYKVLMKDWEKFKDEPLFLVTELSKKQGSTQ